MTRTGSIIITVLLLCVISSLHAAPLTQSSCKGVKQPDGSFAFQLPQDITQLISTCETQLITEDTVSAIYENGPASWEPPVLEATIHNFTLSSCPESVKVILDCPDLRHFPYLSCFCDSSISPAQTSLYTTKPPMLNTHTTPQGNSPFPMSAVVIIVAVVIGVLVLALLAFTYRKRIKDRLLKPTSPDTSASSSSEQLSASQHLPEMAPMIHHAQQE